MPIRQELVFEKGWKESANNRFGYCLVVRFIDVKTGQVLFKFAPTLEDKDFYANTFNSIFTLDDLHKEYIGKIKGMGIKFSSDVKEECGFVSASEMKE